MDDEAVARRRLRSTWAGMWSRCTNPSIKAYRWYGGRGISVCAAWQDFEKFYRWSMSHGYALGLTIDRIDNEGPYSPKNCRWVTRRENLYHRRRTEIAAFGEVKTLVEWAEDPRCSVRWQVIQRRLLLGWSHEDAVRQPLKKSRATCAEGHPWKTNAAFRPDNGKRYCAACHRDRCRQNYERRKQAIQ